MDHCGFGQPSQPQPPSSFNELDGTNGFVLNGIGADDLSGRSVSIAGDIDGNGGLDVLIGGEGDDILAITDAVLQRLDGGTGIDTLRLDGSGIVLDLTDILDPEIQDIEQIDLTGSGDNSLTLDAQDVLNLSDTSNTLTVLGNAGDTLTAIGDWGPGIDNGDFTAYSAGSAFLSVDDDVQVQILIA